ncbi:MAG: carboxypeptidase-like regulatory domain-containing protein, partial [Flavobacterium sp.]
MKIKLFLLTLLFSVTALAQTKGTIKGTLLDKEAKNTPLAYANAVVKGTTIGVNTDEKGQYSLSIEPGNYVVQFSFVGYENVEVPVT